MIRKSIVWTFKVWWRCSYSESVSPYVRFFTEKSFYKRISLSWRMLFVLFCLGCCSTTFFGDSLLRWE